MKRISFLVVAAAVLAFVLWWFSSGQVVKRQADQLLELLSVEKGSGKSARQLGGYTLNRLLAPQVTLRADEVAEANGIFSRAELESAYSVYCGQVKQAVFRRISSREISVDDSSATVSFPVEALVETNNLRVMEGKYHAILRWEKDANGKWRLSSAEWQREG